MVYRIALCSIIALAGVMNETVSAAPAAPKPVVTNKTRFRIPFRFDAEALQRMNARELRLYVSQDQGQHWELTQTIGAESGKFEFQAPGDGEYRFAVKTLDGRNQLHPPGETYETGLMVIVDTVVPQLELEVRPAAPGKVELRWRAADPTLDITSLRLEYTQPGVEEWQAVSVAPKSSGQTTWSVPTGGMVAVRGFIADQAGNQGQAQSQVNVKPSGDANGAPRKPDLRQPIAQSPMTTADTSPLNDRFVEVQHPRGVPIVPKAMPAITPQQSVVEREPVPITHRTQFTADQADARPEITQDRWAEAADQIAPPAAAPASKTGGRQRIVNTRKFQIGYKVDEVGPSGLGGVELFVTQDHGNKWWKYGDDPDQQSPFDVEVPEDGEYGFAIRARSGVGLSNDPPSPGEAPSVVVNVDQTPPALEMLPVRQGTGSQVNQLQLRWKMTEAYPIDKPIALFYAASPNGPWETISTWRADSGEYIWTVNAGMPSQIYFRIVARDAAGNITQEQTARPVIVDLTRPSARIVDIETPQAANPQ